MIKISSYYFSEALSAATPMPMKDLPPEVSMAIGVISDCSDFFTTPEIAQQIFRDTETILINIPISDFISEIELSQWFIDSDWSNFWEYHKWYIGCGELPDYSNENRWPVFLATLDNEEPITDGWHRFHSYVKNNHQTIPVAIFDDPMPEFNLKAHSHESQNTWL